MTSSYATCQQIRPRQYVDLQDRGHPPRGRRFLLFHFLLSEAEFCPPPVTKYDLDKFLH